MPLFLALLQATLPASPLPLADPRTAAPLAPAPGYRLVWSDDFTRAGAPDTRNWTYQTERNRQGWANREKQYYAAARAKNARVANGRLIIEAHVETLDAAADWGGQRYTSARLATRGKASWTYSFIEVRARLPCGVGTWPAIWTLADVPELDWPRDGEIDIMEHVGFDEGVVHQTIHTAAYNHVIGTQKAAQTRLPDACTGFHRYQLDWTPDRMRMGIDGRTSFTFDRADADRAKWPFSGPQYLILNVAIGGDWGGRKGIDDAALPARMEVDYVRVYQAAAR